MSAENHQKANISEFHFLVMWMKKLSLFFKIVYYVKCYIFWCAHIALSKCDLISVSIILIFYKILYWVLIYSLNFQNFKLYLLKFRWKMKIIIVLAKFIIFLSSSSNNFFLATTNNENSASSQRIINNIIIE